MKKQYSLIKAGLIIISVAAGAGITHYLLQQNKPQSVQVKPGVVIDAYDDARDKNDVMKLFKDDWYWLSVNEYTPEHVAYMLDTRSPNDWEPIYTGKMRIAVLREEGKFVGFITYYMLQKETPFPEGKILFLAVSPDFRGKHYGEQLLRYAMKALFAQGAELSRLVTRTTNEKAQKLYRRAGMTEMGVENGFVHFVMKKQEAREKNII